MDNVRPTFSDFLKRSWRPQLGFMGIVFAALVCLFLLVYVHDQRHAQYPRSFPNLVIYPSAILAMIVGALRYLGSASNAMASFKGFFNSGANSLAELFPDRCGELCVRNGLLGMPEYYLSGCIKGYRAEFSGLESNRVRMGKRVSGSITLSLFEGSELKPSHRHCFIVRTDFSGAILENVSQQVFVWIEKHPIHQNH